MVNSGNIHAEAINLILSTHFAIKCLFLAMFVEGNNCIYAKKLLYSEMMFGDILAQHALYTEYEKYNQNIAYSIRIIRAN